jgi:predicted porin
MASACGSAMAQSDASQAITLYGRLDTAVESVRFSAAGVAPSSSAVNLSKGTSWWGLRGRESLGGGMVAYFKLESGMYIDTGEGSSTTSLFNREAFVGLNGSFGSVQLGSQYSPALIVTQTADPFQRVSNGANLNLMQNSGGNRNRGYVAAVNNTIQYITPNFSGFTARAMYGLSERTAEPKDLGRFGSIGLEYRQGPFFVAATAEEMKVATVPAGGARSSKTYTVGATYDLKVVKLHGYLLKNALDNEKDSNAYMAGFVAPAGNGQIRGAYSSRKVENTAGSKATVISLGYTYDMSKRTVLFTTYSRLNNDFASNYGMVPSVRLYGVPANGQDINSFEVGVRHNF